MNICKIENCNSKVHAKSMCSLHYRRKLKHNTHILEHPREYGSNNTSHPLYITWGSMKSRCFNTNDKEFKNYGGRGITVCDSWRYSFQMFLSDMGDKPSGTSIERLNNDGNYEPNNCIWATMSTQALNRRTNSNTGVKGILKKNGKFVVRRFNKLLGEREYIGTADTFEYAKKLLELPRNVLGNLGENNPRAKIKDYEKDEIIKLLEEDNLTQRAIAKLYNLSPARICLIKKGLIK